MIAPNAVAVRVRNKCVLFVLVELSALFVPCTMRLVTKGMACPNAIIFTYTGIAHEEPPPL
eukprot:3642792-Ditylum_brightwellii.AAC.1